MKQTPMAKKKNKQPVQIQLPTRGNFWTKNDKHAFHSAIAALSSKTDVPDGVSQGYRHLARIDDDRYVLSWEEETELADHIAFLFPSEERSETVTAVTLEEHGNGTKLVVRIASNETPKQNVIEEFKELIDLVQSYATEGRERDTACKALFDNILEARSKRILQRLQTHNGGISPFRRGPLRPLHGRLRDKMQRAKNTQLYMSSSDHKREEIDHLFQELEQLCQVYEAVDIAYQPAKRKAALRSAVIESHQLSSRNRHHKMYTLEQQLSTLGFHLDLCDNKEILQVDKIGRYYSLCIAILCIARHHKKLFSDIELVICESNNQMITPIGASSGCYVHGEVKLAMHYEQHRHYPPPRTIGSSKSMCFLCGFFLETHSRYRVSHCHKRLYAKWTIPDVDWMDDDQALRFQLIIKAMTKELTMLTKRARGGFVRYPVESRCHLPFEYPSSSSSSNSSAASSTATIRPVASPSWSITPTQANLLPKVETISQVNQPLPSPVEEGAKQELPPPRPIQDALATPPASPVIIPRPPASRSPSLPAPLSRTPSHLTLLPTSIPSTHLFSFRGPDVEITVSHTLFVFEFASIVSGTLSLSWHDMADSREPFSPDVAAGLHDSLETRPCHLIDLTILGDEAVCMKRDGRRSCDFTLQSNSTTAVKVCIVWGFE